MDFKRGRCDGSITIYIALTLAIILSLFFCVIESARITSLKTRSKAVSYMALDSSFGEFAKPLYEKYGLFGVFTTEDDFLKSVQTYASKNCTMSNGSLNMSFNLLNLSLDDISYNQIYHLTDNDGLFFAAQVISYQKYRMAADELKNLTGLKDAVSDQDLSVPAYVGEDGAVVSKNDASILTDMSGSGSSLYKDSSVLSSKSLNDSISAKVSELLKSNLLLLFVNNMYSVSDTEISDTTADALPSHICVLSSEAKAVQSGSIEDVLTSAIDKGIFISYIHSCFSSYKAVDINNDLSIKYQREYILSGGLSDDNNLLSSALSIVSLRAAFNFTYLLTDIEKRDAAVNLANSMTLSTPIVSQIAAFTLLSLWAYAEAIVDVRDLFNDKKVPLMKTADTWTLSLEGILSLGKSTASNNSGKDGYSYDEYLDMCLYLMDPFTMYFRCMDLIQLDICENVNINFQMNSCVIGADIHFTYQSKPLFSSVIMTAKPGIYTYSVDMLYGYD
jgi:hypothetical protein